MPVSAGPISESLRRAFHAAFLLTGSTDLAENAVLNAIASLESTGDMDEALLTRAVEFVMGQQDSHPTLAHVPRELELLMRLPTLARHCFVLRMLFGISAAKCAAILDLTPEAFERSARAAFEHLSPVSTFDGALEMNRRRS
jgi:DNA-directed RNA polymerase specialized sigma24 family protein